MYKIFSRCLQTYLYCVQNSVEKNVQKSIKHTPLFTIKYFKEKLVTKLKLFNYQYYAKEDFFGND